MKLFFIYFVVISCYSLSIAFAKVNSCARWNTTGITVAGTGVPGSASDQLHDPTGIFIHKQTNALYVADYDNKRVQLFDLEELSASGRTVASFESNPMKVYVVDDNNEPTIYVSLPLINRVEKWDKETSSGVQVGDQCLSCLGISVDKEKNVYMAESRRFRVLKWSPQTNNSSVVAGRTDVNGSTADLLSLPDGIAVDENNGAVYVTDYNNNRVQKWPKGAQKGMTVAGSSTGTEGDDAASLSRPASVFIDEETDIMYIVDRYNNRIQRWLPNAPSGDTIAGGSGEGSSASQFNQPRHLAFDNKGNLYVSDSRNNRVQMFTLIENRPCSSAVSAMHRSSMITFLFSIFIWIVMKRF